MRTLITKIAIASWAMILWVVYISKHRTTRQHTDAFFQWSQSSGQNTILSTRQQKLIGVQYALRENNIAQAIRSMPIETSKDWYNRATLKTVRAYQLMGQNDLSYKQVLQEAQEDFQSASSKTTNIYLKNRIKNNAMLSQNIQHIADIQTCFTDFNTILDDLESMQTDIIQTQTAIQEQLQYIQENKSDINQLVGETCQQRIQDSFNTSYNALGQTTTSIEQYTDSYTQILDQYIDNPWHCLQTDFTSIIQSIQTTQKEITKIQQTYTMTEMALKTKNTDILEQMCKQTQDDTLSNQALSQSIGELLEDLEQQSSKLNTQEQSQNEEQQDDSNQGSTTTQPKYIPLTQEEKTLLEQAQQTNKQRINTMMQIKKNNYNPSQTLQTIFEIFYGDTSEFTIPWW
jgi:hypothetical protein